MKKKKSATNLKESVAWNAMWGGYVRALKSGNLKRAGEFKKHIDSFNARFRR